MFMFKLLINTLRMGMVISAKHVSSQNDVYFAPCRSKIIRPISFSASEHACCVKASAPISPIPCKSSIAPFPPPPAPPLPLLLPLPLPLPLSKLQLTKTGIPTFFASRQAMEVPILTSSSFSPPIICEHGASSAQLIPANFVRGMATHMGPIGGIPQEALVVSMLVSLSMMSPHPTQTMQDLVLRKVMVPTIPLWPLPISPPSSAAGISTQKLTTDIFLCISCLPPSDCFISREERASVGGEVAMMYVFLMRVVIM
mmetsp:Transcript_18063/g.26527  ORF Transcript_18063/g.26527 Transcript_18063/m.26527 type:complete len:256 (+) Transcript_18063:604-1371(+)